MRGCCFVRLRSLTVSRRCCSALLLSRRCLASHTRNQAKQACSTTLLPNALQHTTPTPSSASAHKRQSAADDRAAAEQPEGSNGMAHSSRSSAALGPASNARAAWSLSAPPAAPTSRSSRSSSRSGMQNLGNCQRATQQQSAQPREAASHAALTISLTLLLSPPLSLLSPPTQRAT